MKSKTFAWGAVLAVVVAMAVAAPKAKSAATVPATIGVLVATNPATLIALPAPGAVAAPGLTNQGPTTRYFLRLPPGKTRPLRESATTALKPGVYEAAPYTALVIVPAPCGDEAHMILRPKNVDPDMPMLRPELRFIPHNPGP